MSDRPAWLDRRPERQHVIQAYRMFLGRPPESEAAIAAHLAEAPTIRDLRSRFMGSAEFRAQFDPTGWRPLPLDLPPERIEATATEADLAALLARTGRAWAAMGEAEPHWSVVSDDRFRPERMAENANAFAATGEASCRLLLGLLARHGAAPADLPRCLEFGCGVGRVTIPLARAFARVTGCDISPAHLALARRAGEEAGLPNLSWWQAGPEAPMPDGPWDLWFSMLVLQHNPPPVSRHILARAFAGLAPGGLAVFQVVTHIRGYAFRAADHLAAPETLSMEMHALPQAEVFALAAAAGLQVLEVRDDSHASTRQPGRYGSHCFVLRRPR
jgi:SAM-dependent methyltransferase